MKTKIADACRKYRDRTAYTVGEISLTYGELWNRASRLAELLVRQGTGPVVLYGEKEGYMLIGMFACLLAGRAYVPVNRSLPSARAEKIIRASGASLVLGEGDFAGCCLPEEMERYRTCPVQPQNGDTAYILFTSGTTGEPKGVPISHANLRHFTEWISRLEPLASYRDCNVLNEASFSFDLSTADIYYALTNGHTLTALTTRDPGEITAVFRDREIHAAMMTPTFGKLCLLDTDFSAAQIPTLRCLYFCGEVLEPRLADRLWERFPALEILNAYGPTEATSAVSAARIRREMLDWKRLPVGVIGETAAETAIEEGEIVLRGDSVFGGYLHGGGVFRENGGNGYRTGDLGYVENGYLFCAGRKDCQIKYKGYRIELADIERNILFLPGVRDCAAAAVRSPDGNVRYIAAYVVGETQDIRTALREKLPEWMVPKTVRFVERLPVNEHGKIDRKVLERDGYTEASV